MSSCRMHCSFSMIHLMSIPENKGKPILINFTVVASSKRCTATLFSLYDWSEPVLCASSIHPCHLGHTPVYTPELQRLPCNPRVGFGVGWSGPVLLPRWAVSASCAGCVPVCFCSQMSGVQLFGSLRKRILCRILLNVSPSMTSYAVRV